MPNPRPFARVLVEPAPARKGWHWRQLAVNGSTGAISPKSYDTKGLAKRAGQRQVDLLNHGFGEALPVGETAVLPNYAAVLEVSRAT